jgi:uncharacterized protein YcaQ
MSRKEILIPIAKARRIAIAAQGLGKAFPFGRGKAGILKVIQHLGYVQIDTISVVERAHHHVLWTRVPNYQKTHLEILQAKEKKIFEHWGHAMSYLPMEDFRFTLPIKKYFKEHRDPWPKSDPKIRAFVLDRIKHEGPLMAKDFEALKKRNGAGWWDWKPAKLALERLYYEGELIVTHRKGFQKIYDIPERALPKDVRLDEPTQSEYAQFLIRRTVRAHGFANVKSMAYLRKGMSKPVQTELHQMVEKQELIPLKIKGLEEMYFTGLESLEKTFSIQKQIRFLSPFDNLVIQRNRLLNLFGFDYQIECYVPAPKRKYGYFSMPILFGTDMIGRADMKADRKTKTLHINNLHLEINIKESDLLFDRLATSLEILAHFQQCARIELHHCFPPEYKQPLQELISRF